MAASTHLRYGYGDSFLTFSLGSRLRFKAATCVQARSRFTASGLQGESGVTADGYATVEERTRAAIISAQTGAPFLAWVYGLVEALCSSLASEAVSEADAPCFATAYGARGARVAVRERRPGVASTTSRSKPASSRRSSRPGGLGGGEKERGRAERGVRHFAPARQIDHTACSLQGWTHTRHDVDFKRNVMTFA
jgi:hypothetical protein